MNGSVVQAGLVQLENGSNFSDGVMEFEGIVLGLGGDIFCSFDKKVIRILEQQKNN